MATEPKITKLKPGEGAGDFKLKQGGGKGKGKGYRRGTPSGQTRTQNPCILSDGTVDPSCKKVYQRSVAGRQTLQQFISEKFGQGMTEKDVFMSAVAGLKNRKLGYVGAYLDSKNPSRTYNDAQAMKIVDAVMSKMGVGEHPGARLTGPSGGGRKKGKGGPGSAGKSINQQRKEPGGRVGGVGMPETWAKPGQTEGASSPVEKPQQRDVKPKPAPKTDLQQTLDDYKRGKLSKDDLASKLRERLEKGKTSQALPLPGSAAAASRDEGIERRKAEQEARKTETAPAQKPAAPVEKPAAPDQKPAAPVEKPAAPDQKPAAPEPEPQQEEEEEVSEDTGKVKASPEDITNSFRVKYNQEKGFALRRAQEVARKAGKITPTNVNLSPDDIAFIADETIDELSEQFDLDRDTAKSIINKKFGLNIPLSTRPEPEEKAQPEQPEEQAQPEKPEEQAQPEKPEEQAQPEQPEEQAQPEQPEEQSQPEQPDQPAAPPKKYGSQASRDRATKVRGERELEATQKVNNMLKRMANSPWAKEDEQKQKFIEENLLPQLIEQIQTEKPTPTKRKSRSGLNIPAQPKRQDVEGFTPGPKQVQDLTNQIKQASSPQEAVEMVQRSLFGKTGFRTGKSDNPLEEKPDQYEKFRKKPIEETPRTEAPSGSLFRKERNPDNPKYQPRTGKGFGSNSFAPKKVSNSSEFAGLSYGEFAQSIRSKISCH
jgi:hypothetical protein